MASFLYPYSGFKVLELQQHKNDLQVSPFPPPFFSLRLSLNSWLCPWLCRGLDSTAVASGDHVVSPFTATCRAPALVLQREARTHASGDSSYLDLLCTAFFGSSRCRELSNPDLTSPAMSSD